MAKELLPVILIKGPTASGKTALAMALADTNNIDIVSVDSAQIYKDMDIGTAKPSALELQKYPHQLINIKQPDEVYSASEFVSDVNAIIKNSHKNNKIPCLVGGTMMYFNALQNGLSDLPNADEKIRGEIKQTADAKGWAYCHQQLQKIDATAADRINVNDTQRIQRALEVFYISGKTMTALCGNKKIVGNYRYIKVAYFPQTRAKLHGIIANRFNTMVNNGLIEETQKLVKQYQLHPDMPSLRCVGYRQVFDYLQNKMNKDEMIEKGIIATRQLAKRQMTWLRGEPNLTLLEPYENVQKHLKIITQQL